MPPARSARPRSTPRATRAFLFSDLRDYTKFVERAGDAAAAQLLREYRTIVRREVGKHQGAEVKTEGDSFYVVFESPSDALECGVAVLKRAEAHSRRHPDRPIRIGIGIHAGETVAYDDQFVGSAVNIASRMASNAKAGEILVTDTFRGLVRTGHSYEMEDRGALRLKGVAERVRGWSVQWAPASEASPPPAKPERKPVALPLAPPRPSPTDRALTCPVLVGRTPEIAALTGHLEAAVAGQGRAVILSGEAGVGKSALAREVERLATERGFRLLSGVTLESDTGVPYAPFVSAVRWGLRDLPREEVGRVLTRVAPELAQLFPEAARSSGRTDQASAVERTRLSVALQWLFAALAKDAPLLLVVEDLHWADEASLALLHFLAREIGAARMLLLVTYRSDDLHQRHPLSRLLATFQRERCATEIAVRRLTANEVAQLIRETLAAADPGVRIGTDFRDAIFARSDGNPFFTEELLRSLVETGGIFYAQGSGWGQKPISELAIPGSIRDIIRARIERLPDEARATLSAAAVVGQRIGFDLLRAVTETEELALARQLQVCIDEQLVVEVADAREGVYAFRHALTRDVVYEDLLLPVRRRLHLRIAQRLADDPDTPAALVAPHWRAGGDSLRAAEAFESAAQQALAIHAMTQAIAHLEAAITARGDATVDHYVGLARAYLALDHRKARDAAERALALLGDAADDLPRRVELMQIAGTARWIGGDTQASFDLAGQAVQLVKDRPDDLTKGRAYDWYARAHLDRGDREAAQRWAEAALAVARAVGDGATEASALCSLAAARSLQQPIAGLALIDEAAAVVRNVASSSFVGRSRTRSSAEVEALAPQVLARAHHSGIAHSFNSETGRQRFVRFEQASSFVKRYGYERTTIASFRAFDRLISGDWPAGGSFEVPGDPDTDVFAAWAQLLEMIVAAARTGPTEAHLESASSLARRASRQNEPQWAISWSSYDCLLHAWAGRADELRARATTMLEVAGRASAPELSLVALGRGFNTPVVALALTGQRGRLSDVAQALEGVEGYGGDRDQVLSFVSALDGDDALAHDRFVSATHAYQQRGLTFTSAVDLWALGQIRPLGDRWGADVAKATEVLEHAEARWLVAALRSAATA